MEKRIFFILTALFTVVYAFLFSGLMGLLGEQGIGKGGSAHAIHHTGSGLVLLFILFAMVLQFWGSAKRVIGFRLLSATLISMLIMAFIVGNPDNYGGNVGIFDLAFLIFIVPAVIMWLFHPDRKILFRGRIPVINKGYLTLMLLVFIPFAIYGTSQALIQRNSYPPLSDIHHSHWHAMATLAFNTVILGFIGAFRINGHVFYMSAATLSMLVIGISSVIYPNEASSYGLYAGLLSIVSGMVAGILVYKEYVNTQIRERHLHEKESLHSAD